GGERRVGRGVLWIPSGARRAVVERQWDERDQPLEAGDGAVDPLVVIGLALLDRLRRQSLALGLVRLVPAGAGVRPGDGQADGIVRLDDAIFDAWFFRVAHRPRPPGLERPPRSLRLPPASGHKLPAS